MLHVINSTKPKGTIRKYFSEQCYPTTERDRFFRGSEVSAVGHSDQRRVKLELSGVGGLEVAC